MRGLLVLWLFVLLLSDMPEARAQSSKSWVVVPAVASEDVPWMAPTVVDVVRELRDRGHEAFSLRQATERFESDGSAPPSTLSPAAIEKWIQQTDDALTFLARRDYADAELSLEAAMEFAQETIDELGREHSARVLDACLDLVRLRLELGSTDRAGQQARECRQLVPRAAPRPRRHPPNVVEILEEVDQEKDGRGILTIRSRPSNCTFRVNGIPFGRTPDYVDLLLGDYRLEVECEGEARRRVHRAQLGGDGVEVLVDKRFDDALRTRPFLHLRYLSTSARNKSAERDTRKIMRVLNAENALLVTSPRAGTIRIERVAKKCEAFALISTTASGPNREDVDLAVKAVLRRKCVDLTGARPVKLPCCLGPKFWTGIALASLGTASLASAYGLHVRRGNVGDGFVRDVQAWEMDPTSPLPLRNQEHWRNLRTPLVVTGAAGAAALVAAMPLVLPPSRRKATKTPWWAWLSGGIGVAALTASIVSTATLDPGVRDPSLRCVDTAAQARQCVDRDQQADRAILLGVTAAPLLTMPLVYLLQPKRASVTADVSIGQDGGRVLLQGRF